MRNNVSRNQAAETGERVEGDADFMWDEGDAPTSAPPSVGHSMQLVVNGDIVSTDPTPEEVGEALASLRGADADSFAILGDGDQHYVQTAGCAADGFHVEYREGSDARHFMIPGRTSLDETTAVFESYLRGDREYEGHHRWVSLQGPESVKPSAGAVASLFLVLVPVVIFGVITEVRFAGALTSRYLPLSVFGLCLGVALWTTISASPRRISRQVSFVGMAVVFGFLGAAQVLLGNPGVRVLGMAWGVGVATALLLDVVRNLIRARAEL